MSFVTLDFETYYAKDFSLTKLTTEEYIRSSQFEVIGVAIKIDDAQPEWFSGDHKEIKKRLDQIDWSESALLCHNTMFDGAILSFIFNIVPAYYFDTLCMARAKHGVDVSGSLANLVKMYDLGEKARKSSTLLASVGKTLILLICIVMGIIALTMSILLSSCSTFLSKITSRRKN